MSPQLKVDAHENKYKTFSIFSILTGTYMSGDNINILRPPYRGSVNKKYIGVLKCGIKIYIGVWKET